MEGFPFTIPMLVNKNCYANTLADNGCLSYGFVTSRFARKNKLQRIEITPRSVEGYDGEVKADGIREVAVLESDIDGHVEKRMFLYVVPQLGDYDVILGTPWMHRHDIEIRPKKDQMVIHSTGITVRNRMTSPDRPLRCSMVSAVGFGSLWR